MKYKVERYGEAPDPDPHEAQRFTLAPNADVADAVNGEHESCSQNKATEYRMRILETIKWPFAWFEGHQAAIAALATVVIAVLTAFYVHYARQQWVTMNASVEEARRANDIAGAASRQAVETVSVENRAWLGERALDLIELAPGKKAQMRAVFINSGRSAATDVHWTIRCLARDNPSPEAPTLGAIRPSAEQAVVPNSELTLTCDSPVEMRPEDLRSIADGKLQLVFAGHVAYTDRFRQLHNTWFCGFYRPEKGAFGTCRTGNHAD